MGDGFETEAAEAGARALALSAFLGGVSEAVGAAWPGAVWVAAEVSSVQARAKGYVSLGLVEIDAAGRKLADAQAFVWAREASRLLARFRAETGRDLAAGMRVLLRARASLSPVWGFRLVVEDLAPAWSAGEAERRLAGIRESLAPVWSRNRDLPPPPDLTSVAVVAPVGAGVEDFMREARALEALGLCRFEVFSATFEGPSAASSVAGALRAVSEAHARAPRYDAVAVVRGGGAAASLAWLDHEEIVGAVCLCPVPVVAGIGHERDRTLVDDVAHASLGTPSKAAAHLVSALARPALRAGADWADLERRVDRSLDDAGARADRALAEGVGAAHAALDRAASAADHLAREALGLGPRATLERGYALVVDARGRRVRGCEQAARAGQVWLMFEDGHAGARVDPAAVHPDPEHHAQERQR